MLKNKMVIRADADGIMGAGHVMRCIAIGQAWKRQGGKVVFISSVDSPGLVGRLQAEGFEYIPAQCPPPLDMDGIKPIIKNDLTGWVVLDGYQFSAKDHQSIRSTGAGLLVLDDYNHLPYYDADILLNQNLGAESLAYGCPENTIKLLGPQFALLRNEFSQRTKTKRNFPHTAKNILITMGGADPDNTSLKILKAMNRLDLNSSTIRIIVGHANPHFDSLARESEKSNARIRIIRATDKMPALMEWADLAVSAGGSTTWELSFMGVPSLYVSIAENQRGISPALDQAGAGVYAGWYKDIKLQELSQNLDSLIHNKKKRKTLSENSRQLVPGNGADKIVKYLHLTN